MLQNKFRPVLTLLLTTAFIASGISGCKSDEAKEAAPAVSVEIIKNDRPAINIEPDEEESLVNETEADIDLLEGEVYTKRDNCMMEPMLQNPTDTSVVVCWYTESEDSDSELLLYEEVGAMEPTRRIAATTKKLSRLRGGKTKDTCDNQNIDAGIYRHVAVADNLPEYHGKNSERVKYKVRSGEEYSNAYTLAAKPSKGTELKILLTSDLQIKDMCAANIEKAHGVEGYFDAVWVDGDIVDVIDRAYDWFYADNAFYRVMTGTASDEINGQVYEGAPILQTTPIYTSIGNHDVMGVYDNRRDLSMQFNYPATRENAEKRWEMSDKSGNRERFIEDYSYNTITYEEMFDLPVNDEGNERYYAVTLGDIRLISLDLSRVWRLPNVGAVGKYSEIPGSNEFNDFNDFYGFGDFIFESIKEGSPQYNFLKKQLNMAEYRDAGIKVVMFHMESHSLGGNQIPAFTDPVSKLVKDPLTGLDMTIYDYPIDKDYINTIVEPMLEESGTNLLFNAHSHLYNRFRTGSGMNILETSNVGNSYGAFEGDKARDKAPSAFNPGDAYESIKSEWNAANYCLEGDPYGLKPIAATEAALPGNDAYVASNTITVFSVLDTKEGKISSYYFDTENPASEVVKFDSFEIVSR